MIPLQATTPERLASISGVTLAEARKLVAQVHRGEMIRATSHVRASSAAAVRDVGEVPRLNVIAESPSQIDPFVKYLFEGGFEAVRIPLENPDRFTVCVSSQIGCALACSFCATGRLGLSRNLAAWEIVEQVREVRARLPRGRVHGVVFQGMGEPLANLDQVLDAIAVFQEPCALGIDARAITVCTAGLPHGIRRLAKEAPRVRLALSLHSATQQGARRREIMPIAKAHPLDEVLAACVEHANTTGLSPMWAITLLDGVNDSDEDARAIADRARAFKDETGRMPRLSIIAYNPSPGDHFMPSQREAEYRAALGVPNHRRYSGGGDVAAACGQLAASVGRV